MDDDNTFYSLPPQEAYPEYNDDVDDISDVPDNIIMPTEFSIPTSSPTQQMMPEELLTSSACSAGSHSSGSSVSSRPNSDVVEMPIPLPISHLIETPPFFIQQIIPDATDEDIMDSSIDSELWPSSTETETLILQSYGTPLDKQFVTQVRPSNTTPFVSPAIELVSKHRGESAAAKLKGEMPSPTESNLERLVKEGRILSAVNILTVLLNEATMSLATIRLWTLRFTLLVKLKLYSTAEVEMAMFGNLDACDLYLEYYPASHPGRKGSIVPWSMRLLWSILPLHCPSIGGLYGALDRMYGLVHHLDQAVLAGLPYVQEQRVMKYKTSLLVQIAGALAGSGAMQPAIKVLNQIRHLQPDISTVVTSAMIRVYYQVGNIHKGECLLASIQDKLSEEELEMNTGFKSISHGEYKEAYQHFARVLNINPTNTVASINGAVCLLYLGRLSDSIIQFEGAVKTTLHPMLIFNLVSLYELKTIGCSTHKYHLLDTITNKSDWEAFPFGCLRL